MSDPTFSDYLFAIGVGFFTVTIATFWIRVFVVDHRLRNIDEVIKSDRADSCANWRSVQRRIGKMSDRLTTVENREPIDQGKIDRLRKRIHRLEQQLTPTDPS